MNTYVLRLQEINKAKLALVGGKASNLAELSKIQEIRVPEGFCVTTEAYARAIENSQELADALKILARCNVDERDSISEICAKIRTHIEMTSVDRDLEREIEAHLAEFCEYEVFAVRSSATSEDLPLASSAGQHDTFLNVIGREAVFKHIKKCWASLFTDRAVIYRKQNKFGDGQVSLSVVVQRMVLPQASGVLFTADPVTSNRSLISINASFGLGEAVVSGLVSPDCYKVRAEKIVDIMIATKSVATHPLKAGGTEVRQIAPDRQNLQVLTEEQILELALLGRRLEAHFGCAQDIEWCLADGGFYIVQSRPITTLYPIPQADDRENHVYVSVGHQQMMTDALHPLGLSFFLLVTPALMRKAGGRLFVDITGNLASPIRREILLNTLGKSDPLVLDALLTIIERKDFIKPVLEEGGLALNKSTSTIPDSGSQVELDPAIVLNFIESNQASLDELKKTIQGKSGPSVFDFILEDIPRLRQNLFDLKGLGVIKAAMDASSWLNEEMKEWLGEKNVADILSQSVPNNITSAMGLELLDLADVVRPYPAVREYLERTTDDDFLTELAKFDGGREVRAAFSAYLKKYGMRCTGEIDIARPRWGERPAALVPLVLSNIKNSEAGEARRRFEQGRQDALNKEKELLARLQQLPEGERKAKETKRAIDVLRSFIGYREYPKYCMISRYFIYKQALLREAERLVRAGVIHANEDVYYLTFEELQEAARTNALNYQIICKRREEQRVYERLTPPRVFTSEGEVIAGKYRREDLPAGAFAGLAVSAGVVEGRARVIFNMRDADLEAGDILVTSYTDPSWTPLFVSIKGLVTEVGGVMTHGSVIAREYGLPAVVLVEDATKLIKDGQRIRVNGTDGYVEVL